MDMFASKIVKLTMVGESAGERLSVIYELMNMILEDADMFTLLRCQRVCRYWRDLINGSADFQERLFMIPAERTSLRGPLVTQNPVLKAYFAPVCTPRDGWCNHSRIETIVTGELSYRDLYKLEWLSTPSTSLAFTRPEASWRRMLTCQPPATRFSWEHVWRSKVERETWPRPEPYASGAGAAIHNGAVTVGLLYDTLEALLLRGCKATLTFSLTNLAWADAGGERPINYLGPKLQIATKHVWVGYGPSRYQEFNVKRQHWNICSEMPFRVRDAFEDAFYDLHAFDGFLPLMEDCKYDNDEANWRWTRCDGVSWPFHTALRWSRKRTNREQDFRKGSIEEVAYGAAEQINRI